MSRSWQVPGSLSSELHTRYFCTGELRGMKLHLVPVGKPAPPQPLPHLVTADGAVGGERPRALEVQRLEHPQVHALSPGACGRAHFRPSRMLSSAAGVRCSWNT